MHMNDVSLATDWSSFYFGAQCQSNVVCSNQSLRSQLFWLFIKLIEDKMSINGSDDMQLFFSSEIGCCCSSRHVTEDV